MGLVRGFSVGAARHDPVDGQAERGQILARRIDIGARRHENSHLDNRGISSTRFGRESIHRAIGRPGRQALNLVADHPGQEFPRLSWHGDAPHHDLVGGKFEDDKTVVSRTRHVRRNLRSGRQDRDKVPCLGVPQHRVTGRLRVPNDDMPVLARHDQRAKFSPAFTPGQIQRCQDFDPPSQNRADTHDFAFALSDDPPKGAWGMAPGTKQVRDKVGYPEAAQRSPTARRRHSRSRARP